jgi:hypothetical protein
VSSLGYRKTIPTGTQDKGFSHVTVKKPYGGFLTDYVLTYWPVPAKQFLNVSAFLNSFYVRWRVSSGIVLVLQENQDSPPERLLQTIWLHQRVLRDQLKTLDGQSVKVLHPGFHNLEGGPDFRGAVIQIGDRSAQSGDVEVDLRPSGWRAHRHDRNPAFNKVILHVVWEGDKIVSSSPPLLVLRHLLDAPLGELSLWLGGETAQCFPEELRGKCCAPLRGLPEPQLLDLLHQAAHVRLRSKAAQFQARARQAGWDQSLWEGLFRALGYKHNVWPMQRLAELRPRWAACAAEVLTLQARLLGLSGLLPADLTRTQNGTDNYVRRVWDEWWREQDEFSDGILPRDLWRLHGLRPANHPERRLALGAGWNGLGDLPTRLESWCAGDIKDRELVSSLMRVLQIADDEFWCWHWTLRSSRLRKAQPLLGNTRETDLAINVVLPWLWSRALEGKNEAMQTRLEQRYFQWPAAQDNSVLKLARERLLGTSSRRLFTGAAAQQGLLQIVKDFCDQSNSICERCKLPDLVKEYVGSK